MLKTKIDILNDRYYVGDLIGRGKIADVYSGEDYRLNREVAIKILRTSLVRDPQFFERFIRQAQAAASLSHPNIVSIYDTGMHTFRDGISDIVKIPFIVMEHVTGKTLKKHIQRNSTPLRIEDAVAYTLEILSALDCSHRAGIIHRDVRASNIIIAANSSTVKVTDFGIYGNFSYLGKNGKPLLNTALPAAPIAAQTLATPETRSALDTARYISPEQARGELVGRSGDLYSVAAILYEMLTGQPLFTGESPVEVALQHANKTPVPLRVINPEIPVALESVVLKVLSKDPQERFSTAPEFSRALELSRQEKLGYRSAYIRIKLNYASGNSERLRQAENSAEAVDINDIIPGPRLRKNHFSKPLVVGVLLAATVLTTGIWLFK